jgi:hypothetical protein
MGLKDTIMLAAGTYNKENMSFLLCSVVSVNVEDRTCVVTQIQGESESNIEDVKISAEDGDGFILFPTIGSNVLVALSERGPAYVLMFSDVDSIQLRDKTFGGLVKVKELNESLDSIKQYCADLKQAVFDGLTAVGAGGAANGATGAANFQASMVAKSIEIKDMENPNILHG